MGKVEFVNDIEVTYGVKALQCGIPSIERNRYLRRNHSDLVTIAARSGRGKTTLANQLAIEVAEREPGTVLFFSFEQSPDELKKKGLSYFAEVSPNDLEHLSQDKLDAAEMKLCNRSLAYVGDAKGLWELKKTVDEFAYERRISMVVVDHIQALATNSTKSRKDTIANSMQSLKEMAKAYKFPVVLLAQTSRELERRLDENPSAEPMMSDISDAADIEYWSDVVIILAPNVHKNVTAHVVKNRHGQMKSFDLDFKGNSSKFIDHTDTAWEIEFE